MIKPRCLLTAAGGLFTAALVSSPAPSQTAPANAPFQVRLSGLMEPGQRGTKLVFKPPSGKTLVIEYVGGLCWVPLGSGQTCFSTIITQVNGEGGTFIPTADHAGSFPGQGDLWRTSQQVHFYASGGTLVEIEIERDSPTGAATPIVFSLAGHLE